MAWTTRLCYHRLADTHVAVTGTHQCALTVKATAGGYRPHPWRLISAACSNGLGYPRLAFWSWRWRPFSVTVSGRPSELLSGVETMIRPVPSIRCHCGSAWTPATVGEPMRFVLTSIRHVARPQLSRFRRVTVPIAVGEMFDTPTGV